MRQRLPVAVGIPALLAVLFGWANAGDPPTATSLRFEVSAGAGLLEAGNAGRVLVVVSRNLKAEPRASLGRYGRDANPVLGAEATAFGRGSPVVLDRNSAIAPLTDLALLPPGEYAVQAVFARNRDVNLVNAPGNLYSRVQHVKLDPAIPVSIDLGSPTF